MDPALSIFLQVRSSAAVATPASPKTQVQHRGQASKKSWSAPLQPEGGTGRTNTLGPALRRDADTTTSKTDDERVNERDLGHAHDRLLRVAM